MTGTQCFFFIGCFLLSCALGSDWRVSMPQNIKVLAGSCVLIPCSFEVPDAYKARLAQVTNGVWRKHSRWFTDGIDVFNSSVSQNILRGKIVGNLTERNCTTILHNIPRNYTEKYYFRVGGGFLYTFPDFVNLNVKASPDKPLVTPVGELMEGTQVTINCSAAVPCPRLPPALTWVPLSLGASKKGQRVNQDGTEVAFSTLSFKASHLHHGQRITCAANYPLEQGGSSDQAAEAVILSVLYPPKNTSASVSLSQPVASGTNVTLTCNSSANPKVEGYTWFRRRGSEVTEMRPGECLTITVTEGNTGLYHCEARNQHGKQNSTEVQISVKGEAWWIWVVAVIALLLCGSVILGLCRLGKSRKSPSNLRGLSVDESSVYANINTVTKSRFMADNEAVYSNEDEAVYNNEDMTYPRKTGSSTGQSGAAIDNYDLYINHTTPSCQRRDIGQPAKSKS
ncbi:hypothetical protein MATL_G00033810 [Megalops atlanticus]|uniref:Ig-like domain-containing protein n=1 Tax=Megalops atlanticus TaxID=7932 RepID=A0A9D3TK76_MEGAT|nr:hypothetical protein MATL_G00033810 [Megalops atlanticus]